MTTFRTGYDLQFGERQAYLKTIYSNIKDRSRVLSSKNISTVELSDSGVTVKCDDGSSYDGDILAGADGVRSKVREEMWRLASSTLPELVEHDKNGMFPTIHYLGITYINEPKLSLQSTNASLALHQHHQDQNLEIVISDMTKIEAR